MKLFVGIDPGFTGAIFVIDERGGFVSCHDMPVIVEAKKRRLNIPHLTRIMKDIVANADSPSEVRCVIELVSAWPGMGVSGAFNFGKVAGAIEAATAAALIPYTLVHPSVWTKSMALPKGPENKGRRRSEASRLHPGVPALFDRVKDDGRADAALIAEYARRAHS